MGVSACAAHNNSARTRLSCCVAQPSFTTSLWAAPRRNATLPPQQELARLWDWQHRRAAVGLPPDLAPSAAAGGFDDDDAPRGGSGSGSSSSGSGGGSGGGISSSYDGGEPASPMPSASAFEPAPAGAGDGDGEDGVLGIVERLGGGRAGAGRSAGAAAAPRPLSPGEGVGGVSYDGWAQLQLHGARPPCFPPSIPLPIPSPS